MSSNQQIKSKICGLGCGKKIYWDVEKNVYIELMTKLKHNCPNKKQQSDTDGKYHKPFSTYSKKPQSTATTTTQTVKMSNSFELFEGSPRYVRSCYEKLSDLIKSTNGKVHGSQSHNFGNGQISVVVYYEVPELSRLGVQDSMEKYKFTIGQVK